MKTQLKGIRACVFDAYGTLFDVNSAAQAAQSLLGEKWQAFAELWRTKQLQYTWLRGLGGRHQDFWQVTGEALDFAMATFGLETNLQLRQQLMARYRILDCYPEVPETLERLRAAGLELAILSNGTPEMLAAAVANAGLSNLLDATLSVEEVKVYKPHPSVYQLACDRFHLSAQQICYVSSNGWDAYSAKAFGFRVLWCNRAKQPAERIPQTPDKDIATLAEMPELILT
jgi:2-haloacid dehalogenase